MTMPFVKKIVSRFKTKILHQPWSYLSEISGLIHVGANTGQERDDYRRNNLKVEWIEPIPEVFEQLQKNIQPYKNLRAHNLLISDTEGTEVEFNISNNNGASSSLLPMAEHQSIWPDVAYSRSLALKTTTIKHFFHNARLNPHEYQALVIDTQGAELHVLRGAGDLLENFTFIHVEVPDFEAYTGCALLSGVEDFLASRNFALFTKHPFAHTPQGGTYYEVLFKKMR